MLPPIGALATRVLYCYSDSVGDVNLVLFLRMDSPFRLSCKRFAPDDPGLTHAGGTGDQDVEVFLTH